MSAMSRHGAVHSNGIDVFREILRLNALGEASVLATVIEALGSTPRKAGAKMLVRADGSALGSIGGGAVEQAVIAEALQVLAARQARVMAFNLTEKAGHVCGGTMRVCLDPVGIQPRLIIAGAGHIAAALAALAHFSGFHVSVIDAHAASASAERFPDADEIIVAPVAAALGDLHAVSAVGAVNARTAIVIATQGFELDFAAARAALATPAGFIGIIGSRRKQAVLRATLAREGFTAEDSARITIPVGLPIDAETPQEIAVSIVAQLIAFSKCPDR